MTTTTPQFATLAATPSILRAMLTEVTNEQMAWKPQPERWSIREVLAHLADVEVRNVGRRVRDIATLDAPEIVDYDQNDEYARGTYSLGDGHDNLARLCEIRSDSLAFLRELPRDAWGRTATHHVVGTISIEQLLNLWAFHDLSHIRQIAELVKAVCFWPGIGSLQHYYSVSP